MTPEELGALVIDVLRDAVADGSLAVDVPESVVIERPKNRDHGDWATTVAMQLAKSAGRPPRDVATVIAEGLKCYPTIADVDIAGPGFINVRLAAGAAGELARTIVDAGPAYGSSDVNAGQRINVEFISANPTGPLHLGHTRWAAVGGVPLSTSRSQVRKP